MATEDVLFYQKASSHDRNPPPLTVDTYVGIAARLLGVQRFEILPPRSLAVLYDSYSNGARCSYMMRALRDRWGHVSRRTVQNGISISATFCSPVRTRIGVGFEISRGL